MSRSLVALALLLSACLGGAEELPYYPAPAGCELPPERIKCTDGTCSALYHCPHSEAVRIDDFTWCDLGQPEGFLCYWDDPAVAKAPLTVDACLAEATRTGRWPEGCSDADPPGPHSPIALEGGAR